MAGNKVEICGVDTSTLPKLSHERMRSLLERAHEGDEAARRELIQGNLRLVLSVIQRFANRGEAFKQSVEGVTNGFIVLNKVDCPTSGEWYYAGYYYSTGNEANFDICDLSGWGPDYGDPQTYLDTLQPDYAGYMIKALGIF